MIVLITVPLVLLLLHLSEIDPVDYAIIEVINIEVAMLSPLSEVIKGILPFLGLMIVLLLSVTFVPVLSLYLPSLVID